MSLKKITMGKLPLNMVLGNDKQIAGSTEMGQLQIWNACRCISIHTLNF